LHSDGGPWSRRLVRYYEFRGPLSIAPRTSKEQQPRIGLQRQIVDLRAAKPLTWLNQDQIDRWRGFNSQVDQFRCSLSATNVRGRAGSKKAQDELCAHGAVLYSACGAAFTRLPIQKGEMPPVESHRSAIRRVSGIGNDMHHRHK
jgi:hypothetical protein